MTVPEQGHPLAERVRREDHPVQPDRLETGQLGGGCQLGGHRVEEGFEVGGRAAVEGGGLTLEEPIDAGGRPVAQVALEHRPGGGETGAAMEMRDARQVPRMRPVRLEGCPGPVRIVQQVAR